VPGQVLPSSHAAASPQRTFVVPLDRLVIRAAAARSARVMAFLRRRTAFGSRRAVLALSQSAGCVFTSLP
jgi:hypothetical protein